MPSPTGANLKPTVQNWAHSQIREIKSSESEFQISNPSVFMDILLWLRLCYAAKFSVHLKKFVLFFH